MPTAVLSPAACPSYLAISGAQVIIVKLRYHNRTVQAFGRLLSLIGLTLVPEMQLFLHCSSKVPSCGDHLKDYISSIFYHVTIQFV